MNIYSAIKTSDLLSRFLLQKDTIPTTVHSIYQSACNLKTEQGLLLTLLTPNKDMNPMGIMLQAPVNFSTLSIGDSIILCQHINPCRTNTQLHIPLDRIELVSSRLPKYQKNNVLSLTHFASLLNQSESQLGIYPLLTEGELFGILTSNRTYYAPMMKNYITPHLQQWLKELREQNPMINLRSVIGFGAGLTPSIDDVLVGLLSYLNYIDHEYFDILVQQCVPWVSRTTEVSKAMLLQATDKHFSEGIISFYQSLNSNCVEKVHLSVKRLCLYGHSSGHDTLCGIFIGKLWFKSESLSR